MGDGPGFVDNGMRAGGRMERAAAGAHPEAVRSTKDGGPNA
jgi:hypothetical protein